MKNKHRKIKKHFKIIRKLFLIFCKTRKKVLNISLRERIYSLNTVSKKKIAFFLIINFLIGIAVLTYANTMLYFFPHLICLTLNITITLSIGREYVRTNLSLDKEISSNKHNSEYIELNRVYERFHKKAFHILNLSPCIIVLGIFFWGIFSQHYIKLDIVGVYAVCIVSITVSMSVFGYAQYLWMLWFLYRVSNCEIVPYNKVIPAYTPFLVKIGLLTKHAKWCFFLEGFLYVFQYFILIPIGNITPAKINMPDNFSFIVTWGFIFVAIILAFPLIIFTQEILLAKIVSKFKSQRIQVLSFSLSDLKNEDSKSLSEIYMCNYLVNSLVESPNYPVKIQHLGPTIMSIATILLHIANLLNQYPELKSFLINRFL